MLDMRPTGIARSRRRRGPVRFQAKGTMAEIETIADYGDLSLR